MSKTTTLFAASVLAALTGLSTAACSANATGRTAAQSVTQTSTQANAETSTETSTQGAALAAADSSANSAADSSANSAGKSVGTGKGQACRTVVITGVRVGVREFAFTNADVLRVRDTGSALTSCKLLRGNGSNGYASKCGRSGYNWYQVKIPATRNWVGQSVTQGFVPVTCARVR